MLDQSIATLKAAREEHERAKAVEERLRVQLLADAEYQEAKANLETAVSDLEKADAQVREDALAAYEQDPSTKKVHPKVSIAIKRDVIIGDAKKVLTWVKTHLPLAIKIDTTKLKSHTRAVQATQPVPEQVARIESVPTVRISKVL